MLPFIRICEVSLETVALATAVWFGRYRLSGSLKSQLPSVMCVLYPGSDAGDGLFFLSDSGLCLRGAFGW